MKVLLFLCFVVLAQAKVIKYWEWEEEPTTTETPVTMTTTDIPYTTDPTWSDRVCSYTKTPRHGRREPITAYKCCKGWTGDVETGCQIPVCRKECQNGGVCVAPDQCQCQPGLEGPRCEKVKKGLCWTEYINNDVPHTGKGDFETIFSLRKEIGICKHSVPEAIECQTSAGVPLRQTTQNVTCDRRVGLICDNSECLSNGKWACDELPCEYTTTETPTTTPITPVTTTPYDDICVYGSEFYEIGEVKSIGCETCICTDGEWSCTRKYCAPEVPYPTHTTCYNRTTKTSYRAGEIFTQDCNICTCNAGIIQCSTTPCRPVGPCTQELVKYQTGSRQLKGTFPPKCLPSGYYQPEQCHKELGVCYCVTPTGQRIKDTLTFGYPDCSQYMTTTEYTPFTETTTPYTPETTTQYTESSTYTTEGVTTVPPCLRLLQTRKTFPGGFVPTCQADGSYHPTQCHANGYCFCVDQEGYMIKGTEQHVSQGLPDCTPFFETTTPVTPYTTEYTTTGTPSPLCYELRSRSQTKPTCQKDGTFEPLQCDKTSRYCYCVTPTEGTIIPETLVRSWEEKPNCEEYIYDICVYGSEFYEIGEVKTIGCEICTCQTKGGWSCERKPECESKPQVCTVRGKIYQQGQTIKKGCNTCICVDGQFSCTKMICPPTYEPTTQEVCYDRRGNEFQEGETFQKDCNICVCTYGKWDCTRKPCTPEPRRPKTCTMGRRTYRSTETVQQGCNTCICTDGEWSCTRKYCAPEVPYPTHTTCYNRTTKTSYRAGEIFTQDCNICTCNAGIIQCSTTPCRPVGPCTQELVKYQTGSRQLKGTFPPKCLPNGYYQPEQCHKELGVCYCVTPTGQRIKDTLTFGYPDCSQYMTTTEYTPFTETTTPYTPETTTQYTESSTYTTEETTTPVTPYTTEYTTTGTPSPLCYELRSRSQTKPTCQKDGTFEPLQCDKTSRYCYCVTPTEGTIIPETLVRSWEEKPNCEEYIYATPTPTTEYPDYEVPPCLKLLQVVRNQPRHYTPTCLADGTFAPLQCDPTTKYCHCVDPRGFQIRGTVRHFRQGTPDCTTYTTTEYTPYTTTEYTPQTTTEYTATTTEYTATTTEYTQTTPYPKCWEMREYSRGKFTPKCTEEGTFEPLQCQEDVCYCVHPVKGVMYRESMFQVYEQRTVPDCDTYWMTTTTPTPCVGEECTTTYPCEGEECTTPYPCQGEECTTPYPTTTPTPCEGEECTTPTPCEGEECTTPFPTPTPCVCEECPDPSLCQGEECTTPTPQCVCETCSPTPCVIQQRQYIPSPGHFLPMCEPDGSYAPLQCHDTYGYCFCATPKGYEIPGTRVFGVDIPDCSFVYATTTEYTPYTTTEYTPETTTEYTPQTTTEYTPETTTEYTPQTTTEYTQTTEYTTTSPYLDCWDQLEIFETLPQVFRTVRPRCKPDGTFYPIQCNIDLRICYCVTPQGDEIHGTVTKGTTPDCTPYITRKFVAEDSCIVDGFVYKQGETFYQECNKCICDQGVTMCTILPCTTSDVCYHPTTGIKYQPGEVCTHQCQECMCQDSKWACIPQEDCQMTTTAEPTTVEPTTPVYSQCEIKGITFQVGETYYDDCNRCTCTPYGGRCTLKGCPQDVCYCPMTGSRIQEGQTITKDCKECTCKSGRMECYQREDCEVPTPMCEVDGFFYRPGQSYYDQCNTCTCSEGRWKCSQQEFCETTTAQTTTYEPTMTTPYVPTTCVVKGQTYYEGETFYDGCNECVCREGFPACPAKPCTPETTPEKSCKIKDFTFQSGQKFFYGCRQCICKDGEYTCEDRTKKCPRDVCFHPTTGEKVYEEERISVQCKSCKCIEGQLKCKEERECRTPYTTPVTQCYVNGTYYQPGQEFFVRCNQCICKDGVTLCTKKTCPTDKCYHPFTGVVYRPKQSARVDCNKCKCAPDGEWMCTKRMCRPTPITTKPIPRTRKITEPQETCTVDGCVYYSGQRFFQGCNKCTCTNGRVSCTRKGCSEKFCYSPITGEKFRHGETDKDCTCKKGEWQCPRDQVCPWQTTETTTVPYTTPEPETCPNGEPLVECFVDPCRYTTCPAYPGAVCVPNYCGSCQAVFYNTKGSPVVCEP
uniref:VWFC domain-containing protein n=1 Tax=Branchiostoma floridae TaxID=7739 RepID=C3Z6Y1_BRAFL|eukprot:XP_002595565.1 hypothetical protein BRAFLDRAFT_117488 [Branchiostoma floridae]